MIKPSPHRHSRSRNLWMEGLSVAGMSSNFGKIAIMLLLLIGVLLVSNTHHTNKAALHMHQLEVLNDAYQAGHENRKQELIMVPIKNGNKMLLIEDFALQAGKLDLLLSQIKAGDKIQVWVDATNDSLLRQTDGGRRVQIMLLSKNGKDLISETAYNKELGNNGKTGWWVIAIALSMVPYFFIARPKIQPIWVLLMVLTAMVAWLWLT